jgi:hypothetical protein
MSNVSRTLQAIIELRTGLVAVKSGLAEVKSEVAEIKSDLAEVKSEVAEVKRGMLTMATKGELAKLRIGMRNEIVRLGTDLRAEMRDLRDELVKGIDDSEIRTAAAINGLAGTMNEVLSAVRAQNTTIERESPAND